MGEEGTVTVEEDRTRKIEESAGWGRDGEAEKTRVLEEWRAEREEEEEDINSEPV